MAILGVDSKCYILALFIRSDGQRFLLGSGYYEFKDKQQHFAANTIANDVIEVQGNDGYMLGGQVRRPGVQSFDGYVGDGTTSKTEVEEYRRDFLSFFRKNFMYKVVYVFPDGSAIQRKRGFLVDAPTVQELYQIYPEYHVALNFEDINYYFYDEDADGDEIYGKSAVLGLTVGASGGLIWDNLGAVSIPYSWTEPVEFSGSEVTIMNGLDVRAPITDLQLKGDTFQQTYTGKNLFLCPSLSSSTGITRTRLGDNSLKVSVNSTNPNQFTTVSFTLSPDTTYTFSFDKTITGTSTTNSGAVRLQREGSYGSYYTGTFSFTTGSTGATSFLFYNYTGNSSGATIVNEITWSNIQLEVGSTATSYEPYTGSTPSQIIPSPNPDYPQTVQTVTGEQTVSVTGKNIFSGQYSQFDNTGGTGSTYAYFKLPDDGVYQLTLIAKNAVTGNDHTYLGFTSTGGNTTDPRAWAWQDHKTANAGDIITKSNIVSDTNLRYVSLYGKSADTLTWFTDNFDIMLEKAETATTYEPYQGSETYTIDLGSTELCKIGDYQDYIYKSGDNWYVHKECAKNVIDTSTITVYTGYTNIDYALVPKPTDYIDYDTFNYTPLYFTHAICYLGPSSAGVSGYDNASNIGKAYLGAAKQKASVGFEKGTSLSDIKTTMTGATYYYPLAAPIDTQITNQTLIEQLEALGAMKLFVGGNNILVTATTPNLPAILEASYPTGVDFSGAGFEWEPGEAGGTKIITVDSIDNVYPLLTVTGPATNPTVTNIPTGTIFRYNGTVTSSQVLKVDMMNKTATLNGTSVIGNVSGDWLYFQPGDNRVDYSTNNADAPNALIEWQEIVG